MKIKALRPLNGHYGQKPAGAIFELGEAQARRLLERGVVERVPGPAPRRHDDASNPGPANGPLAGSPTGAVKPASSSGAAPAPHKRASRSRKAASPPSS